MQLSVDVSLPNILNLISEMSLSELEEIRKKIVERELYFRKFQPDAIDNIVEDFQQEGYSSDFLKDLENGLKQSSVYNDN